MNKRVRPTLSRLDVNSRNLVPGFQLIWVQERAKMNAERSDDRRMKRQNLTTTNTTCFACRSVGHAARDCPNVLLAAQGINNEGTATLLGDGEKAEGGEAQEKGKQAEKGMKRGKGKRGGEVTGGRCYRYVLIF